MTYKELARDVLHFLGQIPSLVGAAPQLFRHLCQRRQVFQFYISVFCATDAARIGIW
jgi:hypothetical protein